MPFPQENQPIDVQADLVNLAHYRKSDRNEGNRPDPLLVLVAYAQEELVYDHGRIQSLDAATYAKRKNSPDLDIRNTLVNKFGQCYLPGCPLLLHRRLADVIIDAAIDMRDRYRQFTVVMDGLRTYEGALRMQHNRPDLVASGMLAPAGSSAHNRALAVDSKLFELIDAASFESWETDVPLCDLVEADEHGHLDDEQDMAVNSRFYTGPMSDAARANRLHRLHAWQRASVKNRTPIANLLAEFWDDRVPGSPADMWRVAASRLLCLGHDANPATNPALLALKTQCNTLHTEHVFAHGSREELAQHCHLLTGQYWPQLFTPADCTRLEHLLGIGGGSPPALGDYIFHEWLQTLHDSDVAPLY